MIRKLRYLIVLIIVAIGIYILWMFIFNGSSVKLYFATKDGMYLTEEDRNINGDKIEGALDALIAGPKRSNLSPTIPEEVQVLSYKLTEGLLVVNFNEKLITNHWGGSTGELLTVYSIVNTLCQFSEIERVQILVEGRKVETLAGHFVLEDSITPDYKMIK